MNLKVKKSKNHTYTVVQDLIDLQDSIFPTVNIEISEQAALQDHLYAFERFLQGIGFVLPENSHLEFVDNDEDSLRDGIEEQKNLNEGLN